jgi:hypothetical protein
MAREDSIIWMIIGAFQKWLKTRHALISIVGTIVLFSLLAWIFSAQADAFPAQNPYNILPPTPSINGPANAQEDTVSVTGYVDERSSEDEHFDLVGDMIYAIEVTVSFRDEPNSGVRYTNNADNFDIAVTLPDGTSDSKTEYATNSAERSATFVFEWDEGITWADKKTGANNYVDVTVECTDAGDHTPFFSPFNFRTNPDDGNAYTVQIWHLYTGGDV